LEFSILLMTYLSYFRVILSVNLFFGLTLIIYSPSRFIFIIALSSLLITWPNHLYLFPLPILFVICETPTLSIMNLYLILSCHPESWHPTNPYYHSHSCYTRPLFCFTVNWWLSIYSNSYTITVLSTYSQLFYKIYICNLNSIIIHHMSLYYV